MARQHDSQPPQCHRPHPSHRRRFAAWNHPSSSVMTILRLLGLLVVAAAASSAVSQPANPDSAPYSRRVWQSADGLPEDFAQSLARTPDGYLWIGTSGGLVRFDGVRFVVFNHENQPAFREDSFYSLFVTRDGTLWGGTEGGGLVRYRGGVFRVFGPPEGLANGFVRVIRE